MNLRLSTTAALASATMIAAGALTGCSSKVESAQTAVPVAPQGTERVTPESGHGIAALTQGVNWARMEIAPPVQGF